MNYRMLTILMILMMLIAGSARSQESDRLIQKGNELYKQQQYPQSELIYAEVLKTDPNNATAKFNQANAMYKQNKADEAIRVLNDLAFKSNDASVKSKAYYNKGAILSTQKKLEESIDAYKDALRQDPSDKDARENLQKALLELKKKNQSKKDDNKKQKQQQKQQQKPQPKMSQKEAEQRLQLLEQKEKDVQQRLQNEKSKQGGGVGKDW
ncbi:tetratricopeptide repeat protein [Terrimonas sp. NA20]|uniref:Tetratricopeptide repeat protein n=1 Tax=Terrimonas ginsenosidimutans TaxID=2908004 RepID=A0ABS9KNK2_9BACT|nr:tetratricopeptide repeat protein [Terrimonas ginsenosidimutans]MCG2613912.1 tetratricopeptide repeat protein [Terrimonas ginsenosidimutans]